MPELAGMAKEREQAPMGAAPGCLHIQVVIHRKQNDCLALDLSRGEG